MLVVACGGPQDNQPEPPPEVDASDVPEVDLSEVEPLIPEVEVIEPVAPPHPLQTFFEGLRDIDAGEDARVSILHVGDSHTASDTITGELRLLFQTRFGDAGRGYAYPGEPWRRFRQQSMRYGATGEWTTENAMRSSAEPPFGMGGLRIHSNDAGATVWRETCGSCQLGTTMDSFSIHYLFTPGGGQFRLLLDGQELMVVDTDSQTERFAELVSNVSAGEHRITVEVVGDGEVHLFGIATESDSPGVLFESFGINGAQARHFIAEDAQFTIGEVAARDPSLVIVAFGTNEAYQRRFEGADDGRADAVAEASAEHAQELVELVGRYREGAPDASCLILLPPDASPDEYACSQVELGGETFCVRPPKDGLAAVLDGQRAAAEELGCAVWDQQYAMGGPGGTSVWHELDPALSAGDGVHLTGTGYDRLAAGMFADVMRSYEAWRLGEPAELRTSVIEPEYALPVAQPAE